jgi:hypothetical protein
MDDVRVKELRRMLASEHLSGASHVPIQSIMKIFGWYPPVAWDIPRQRTRAVTDTETNG